MSEANSWIFAYLYGGEYVAEEIIDTPESRFDNLEYADARSKEYQLWEHPSGKIFNIVPDRELSLNENQYATPYSTKGTVWLPKLVEVGQDKAKVTEAYSALVNKNANR